MIKPFFVYCSVNGMYFNSLFNPDILVGQKLLQILS